MLQTAAGGVRDHSEPAEEQAAFYSIAEQLEASHEPADLERLNRPLVDRLLLTRGIADVDIPSRLMLLEAFALALRRLREPGKE